MSDITYGVTTILLPIIFSLLTVATARSNCYQKSLRPRITRKKWSTGPPEPPPVEHHLGNPRRPSSRELLAVVRGRKFPGDRGNSDCRRVFFFLLSFLKNDRLPGIDVAGGTVFSTPDRLRLYLTLHPLYRFSLHNTFCSSPSSYIIPLLSSPSFVTGYLCPLTYLERTAVSCGER